MTVWLAGRITKIGVSVNGSVRTGTIAWPSASEKLISLFAPIRSYSVALDVVVVLVLLVGGVAMLRGARVHRIVVVGFVLFALFLLTPKALLSTSASAADARYVIPFYLLLVLSIEPHWGRLQKAAFAVALCAMAVRTGNIASNWLTISHRSEHVLAMGDILPAGARIYAMKPAPGIATKLDRGYFHLIQFWTVSHDADISTFFASPGQQPLVFRKPPCGGSDLANCLASYDYIWTYGPPASLRPDILRDATPAATWEQATLWRVNRAAVSPIAASASTRPQF
jgi:hypothetical protein